MAKKKRKIYWGNLIKVAEAAMVKAKFARDNGIKTTEVGKTFNLEYTGETKRILDNAKRNKFKRKINKK